MSPTEVTMRKTETAVERRYTSNVVEVRKGSGGKTFHGHAAVFGRRSQNLGGFVEQVDPAAFNKTLGDEADVRALQNHDENRVLGRSKSGTLRLSVDDSGLYYEIDAPDTSYARDLAILVERGDVNQSSFAFHAIDDDWGLTEDDFPIRTLKQVALVDTSIVTYPAYLDADSGIRSALMGLSKRSGTPVVDLSDPDAIKRAIKGKGPAAGGDDECDCEDPQGDECVAKCKEAQSEKNSSNQPGSRETHTADQLEWARRAARLELLTEMYDVS